ncbi:MAG TPA: hypothetical protein HPP58_07735 [Deltaproteobacteria bacterium]|nr:hypothetical protein [Deltaproteobacteria bacterium]HIJ37146.1 hypothetical protein [Deltaproteobacteria bacterium]HIJ42287.1 hypothetical protein [Deltaproteobacteria bacterium]
MARKRNVDENEKSSCPVGKFFKGLEKMSGKKPEFMKHLRQSRLEFLKAVKCLVDAGIEHLEKKNDPASRKKAVKIKVE